MFLISSSVLLPSDGSCTRCPVVSSIVKIFLKAVVILVYDVTSLISRPASFSRIHDITPNVGVDTEEISVF